MTTIFSALIFSGLLAVLLTLPVYLRERRRLHLARAKLEISKAVTAMEELMLSGTLIIGETCHDKLFKTMIAVQSSDHYSVPWKFWKAPSDEEREFRKKLHSEVMAKGSEVSEPLGQFIFAYFRAYNYRRPFLSKLFCVWVLCFAVGIVGTVVAVRQYKNLEQGYHSMRRVMAEWLLAWAMTVL